MLILVKRKLWIGILKSDGVNFRAKTLPRTKRVTYNDKQINYSKGHTILIFMFLKQTFKIYKVKIERTARRNREIHNYGRQFHHPSIHN